MAGNEEKNMKDKIREGEYGKRKRKRRRNRKEGSRAAGRE